MATTTAKRPKAKEENVEVPVKPIPTANFQWEYDGTTYGVGSVKLPEGMTINDAVTCPKAWKLIASAVHGYRRVRFLDRISVITHDGREYINNWIVDHVDPEGLVLVKPDGIIKLQQRYGVWKSDDGKHEVRWGQLGWMIFNTTTGLPLKQEGFQSQQGAINVALSEMPRKVG